MDFAQEMSRAIQKFNRMTHLIRVRGVAVREDVGEFSQACQAEGRRGTLLCWGISSVPECWNGKTKDEKPPLVAHCTMTQRGDTSRALVVEYNPFSNAWRLLSVPTASSLRESKEGKTYDYPLQPKPNEFRELSEREAFELIGVLARYVAGLSGLSFIT